MGDFLHYSSDRAGVTDLFTNAVRLAPAEKEDPRHWLGPVGHGPPEQLLTFLHEVTHHWCFSSDVGQALLFLAARADMNAHALSALSDDIDEHPSDDEHPGDDDPEGLWREYARDLGPLLRGLVGDPRSRLGSRLESARESLALAVHDDVTRIQVAQAVLRPLAEGLALFAEFDAISRPQSEAWSPLPYSLVLNFAGRERLARGPHVEPLRTLLIASGLLRQVRTSPMALSRKATVLGSSLAAGSGGYLLGYLTVKSLWRHLSTQDTRLLSETDLSLMYMRSFFYDDLGLAALLVQPPEGDAWLSARRIIDHVQERFMAFGEVREADVRAYEKNVLALGDHEWVSRPGLLRSAAQDERDVRLMKRVQEDIETSTAAEVFDFAVRFAIEQVNSIIARRTYLTACSVPVRVRDALEPPGALDVVWRDETILTFPAEDLVNVAPEPEPPSATTTDRSAPQLDIVLGTTLTSGEFLARGAVLHEGDRVMACSVTGVPDHQARFREDLVVGFSAREALFRQGRTLQKVAGAIVEKDELLRDYRDRVDGRLDSVVDELYRPTALWFAREGTDLDALANRMEERGLLSVWGSSRLLRGMTLLGLSAGLNPTVSFVAERFQEFGLALDDILREAERLWETEGFPPSAVRGGGPDGWVVSFF
ncbi:hypothetical protein [Streptomyces longispororuber]|uniref:hypothetical protein n=1 Tax=Streptomyces longispororuber TaxID=68230 RepID=UPI00210A66ED|nr:hypothetical protein [Streptomyces longispororuber]MCQ4211731.1 hypothetical protein [Streptomyces longispororuber]